MVGCSLVSFHFLWAIQCPQAVHFCSKCVKKRFPFVASPREPHLSVCASFMREFQIPSQNYTSLSICTSHPCFGTTRDCGRHEYTEAKVEVTQEMVCTSLGSLLRPLFYFLCYIHFSLSVPNDLPCDDIIFDGRYIIVLAMGQQWVRRFKSALGKGKGRS